MKSSSARVMGLTVVIKHKHTHHGKEPTSPTPLETPCNGDVSQVVIIEFIYNLARVEELLHGP
jgi:hypothetical protein